MNPYCGESANSKCRRPSSAREELVLDTAMLEEKWKVGVARAGTASILGGSTASAFEGAVLDRSVSLNAGRTAEEASGAIRWLRFRPEADIEELQRDVTDVRFNQGTHHTMRTSEHSFADGSEE